MSGLFGGGGSAPPPAPPPPTVATPQVKAAADAQRMRARTASGRAATMLSDQDEYQRPTVGTKKLLG
jgi:hypothetical protein